MFLLENAVKGMISDEGKGEWGKERVENNNVTSNFLL